MGKQGRIIRKSRFTEKQISIAPRHAEAGTPVDEVCRKLGVSQATFFHWKKRYDNVGARAIRELRQRREENREIKGDRYDPAYPILWNRTSGELGWVPIVSHRPWPVPANRGTRYEAIVQAVGVEDVDVGQGPKRGLIVSPAG